MAFLFGRVDAERFMDEVDLCQALKWAEYFECEPAGPHIDDAQHARLAAVLMNAFRGEKDRPIEPERLMFGKYGQTATKRQTPEQVQSLLLGWANKKVAQQKRRDANRNS